MTSKKYCRVRRRKSINDIQNQLGRITRRYVNELDRDEQVRTRNRMNQAYNAATRYAGNIARTRSFQNGLSTLGRRAMAMNADDPRDVARTTAQSQATFARLRNRGYARATYTGLRNGMGSAK